MVPDGLRIEAYPPIKQKDEEMVLSALRTDTLSGSGETDILAWEHEWGAYCGREYCLATNSGTAALHLAYLAAEIKKGDEVITTPNTFVSTSNAFVLRGANIVFADSEATTPNIDASQVESLITPKTKAIIPVHYAGVSCNMDKINRIAKENVLYVVEDAAQAIDSFYNGKPLGSLGHLATFSFHETKNIISGEGGMLVVNDKKFAKRAEIIREKGTNRSAFFRGEVDKYGWVDIGSSFLPSDIIAAFLFAQLEHLEAIQARRKKIWGLYFDGLKPLQDKGYIKLPFIPNYATNNAHMFYVLCCDLKERSKLISYLNNNGILAVFHYLSLHKSPFYMEKHGVRELPNADRYTDCLIRLPMYFELSDQNVERIIQRIRAWFGMK